MAYSPGSKITATDYNAFVTRLNKVWGTGTGNYGYGQPELPTVATSDEITAEHWANLNDTIIKASNHQGTTTETNWTAITSPVISDNIATLNGLTNNITLVDDNRLDISSSIVTGTVLNPDDRITLTDTNSIHIFQVDIGTNVRHFFNAGGFIELEFVGYETDTLRDSFLENCGIYRLYRNHSEMVGTNSGYTFYIDDSNKGYFDLPATGNLSQGDGFLIVRELPGEDIILWIGAKTPSYGSIHFLISYSGEFTSLSYMTHVTPKFETTYIANTWGTISINDQSNIIPSITDITLSEGDDSTIQVSLREEPTGNVIITASETSSKISVSPSSRTFTTSNWDTNQSFTITAEQDSDYSDETALITLTSSVDSSDSITINVNIIDDDYVTIIISDTNITVTEGSTTTFNVKLDKQPIGGDVIVTAVETNFNISVSPSSRTFTTSNWNTNQSFTVTGESDSNGIDDIADIMLNVSGNTVEHSESVFVVIEDSNPAESFILIAKQGGEYDTEINMTITEGETAYYSSRVWIRLREKPTSGVTVTPSSNNSDISFSTNSVSWTVDNWYITRYFNLYAGEDSDLTNDSAVVTFTASGASTDTATANVTITDNDITSNTHSQALFGWTSDYDSYYAYEGNNHLQFGDNSSPIPSSYIDSGTSLARINRIIIRDNSSYACWISTVYPSADYFTDSVEDGLILYMSISGYTHYVGNFTRSADTNWAYYSGNTNPHLASMVSAIKAAGVNNVEASFSILSLGSNGVPNPNLVLTLTNSGETYVRYDVKLSAQPIMDVKVFRGSSYLALTFTPSNWNTAQSHTISGSQGKNDETVNWTLTATGGSTDSRSGSFTIIGHGGA